MKNPPNNSRNQKTPIKTLHHFSAFKHITFIFIFYYYFSYYGFRTVFQDPQPQYFPRTTFPAPTSPAYPWPAEPWPAEPWPAEPWPAEPWPAEPWPAEPRRALQPDQLQHDIPMTRITPEVPAAEPNHDNQPTQNNVGSQDMSLPRNRQQEYRFQIQDQQPGKNQIQNGMKMSNAPTITSRTGAST
jgi:hypothetical protein